MNRNMNLASDFKTKLRRLLIGLAVLIVVSLIIDRVLFSHYVFPAILRFGLGGILLLAGLALPAISGRQLRTRGRSQRSDLPRGTTDRLVTAGIYAYLRHPAFEGFWLLTFGLGLIMNSPAFVFIAAPLADLYIFYFALDQEEAEGFEKFGCDYETYRRRTPAFWPRCLFRWTMKHKFNCP